MRKLTTFLALIAAVVAIAPAPATAVTIVSQTGTATFDQVNQVDYQTWTQASSYTGVTISATFRNVNATPAPASGTAYLTTQIGPGTTAANNVAAPFSFSQNDTALTPVTLFSGLTLGPGTYYLVISSNNNLSWPGISTATTTLDSGVTRPANYFAFSGLTAAFPPASSFALPKAQPTPFSVTGSLVPEPSSLVMWLGGLSGMLLLGRRGRST